MFLWYASLIVLEEWLCVHLNIGRIGLGSTLVQSNRISLIPLGHSKHAHLEERHVMLWAGLYGISKQLHDCARIPRGWQCNAYLNKHICAEPVHRSVF